MWKNMGLTGKIIVAMILGIVLGLFINYSGLNAEGSFVNTYITNGFLAIIGKLFVNSLKMLVVPLVLISLICGVCGIGDIRLLGRIGTKTFMIYMMTTALAIATAIGLGIVFGIGKGMNVETAAEFEAASAPPLLDVFSNIIPSNPISAMANGDMLSIIFFAVLIGISILMVGKPAKGLVKSLELINEVILKMVTIIMNLAPYGVFALLTKAMAELGLDLIWSLLGYVAVLVGSLAFHFFITMMIVLKLFSGLSVKTFLAKMREVQIFAFSTSSSNATIPITLRTVTKRMGVNNSVASFTVPFGATINMDGTAIMQGTATIFIANIYGIDLGVTEYLTVILMSVLASIGTAGVPGVGLIMLSMVFAQVGLPIEGIGLILGVDRILDMLRTAVNVGGDAAVTAIVAKSENKMDVAIYNDPDAGAKDVFDGHIDEDNEREFSNVFSDGIMGSEYDDVDRR
ncbi:dicarboxylate/amino acid:cation symporter [Psychrobacter okhotskensis]|jgi:Na+/H+-dicarboxylate symporter|uniref:dicarboxylate/amino acid:cation symporter n=1 Tax=Psychrobacter TaxID=497 RepID=UPI000C31C2B5|nr:MULTISPECIES: dicarboxylate/amino acid:cation symporter [Psychrobacter]NRD68997.1 dicarboxylate/amino acid:cation symporter [Psychrobacter okhotskensis]PKG34335.1 dicarboxylate/amino acid:cation symporter [Psychrobacter sp. Sarcosine-3u-12]